jgi:phosphonate transport system ATP-binding protein
MELALHVKKLNKHFASNKHALKDIDLTVKRGEMVALIGASGSGKSTLLRHIAGLVAADAGSESRVDVDGRCVQAQGKISHDVRRARAGIGFVFQQFNLVDRLSVLVNVMVGQLHSMPRWRGLFCVFSAQERARAYEALQRVGIAECHAQRASTLSGGQQQRAAIARAMVQGAKVVLADEPIASLDPESSRKVMELLTKINKEDACTILVSLHQVDVALKYCTRIVALNHGRVVFDGDASILTPAILRELYGMQAEELMSPIPGAHAPTKAPNHLSNSPDFAWANTAKAA